MAQPAEEYACGEDSYTGKTITCVRPMCVFTLPVSNPWLPTCSHPAHEPRSPSEGLPIYDPVEESCALYWHLPLQEWPSLLECPLPPAAAPAHS